MVIDWRIQWRESFESFLKVQGLHLKVYREVSVMYDHEDDRYGEEKLPPSNVMWEIILNLATAIHLFRYSLL